MRRRAGTPQRRQAAGLQLPLSRALLAACAGLLFAAVVLAQPRDRFLPFVNRAAVESAGRGGDLGSPLRAPDLGL
jgi:hypothetical protein